MTYLTSIAFLTETKLLLFLTELDRTKQRESQLQQPVFLAVTDYSIWCRLPKKLDRHLPFVRLILSSSSSVQIWTPHSIMSKLL